MEPWPLGWSQTLGTGGLWTGRVSHTWEQCYKSPSYGGPSVTPAGVDYNRYSASAVPFPSLGYSTAFIGMGTVCLFLLFLSGSH